MFYRLHAFAWVSVMLPVNLSAIKLLFI